MSVIAFKFFILDIVIMIWYKEICTEKKVLNFMYLHKIIIRIENTNSLGAIWIWNVMYVIYMYTSSNA